MLSRPPKPVPVDQKRLIDHTKSPDTHVFRKIWMLNVAVAILFGMVSILLLIDAVYNYNGQVSVYGIWWIRGEVGPRIQTIDRSVHLTFLPFAFTLLACIDHLMVSCVCKDTYEKMLERHQNPFRWIEYSMSASIMNILIAIECGILDVLLLTAIGALTASCMAFGWVGEVVPDEWKSVAFWIGCIPFGAVWGIILSAFGAAVHISGSVPDFVWAIVCCLFVLECAFGINQIMPRTFIKKEVTFILLSPTAKLLLAGLTYGGIAGLAARG